MHATPSRRARASSQADRLSATSGVRLVRAGKDPMSERAMSLTTYPGQGLHAGILDELGRSIANGVFAEGVLLPRESALQEQFGASRQTVREAIKVLAAKGMVRARRRAGTFVQPRGSWNLLDPDVLRWHSAEAVPRQMLQDLFEIRYLIEPACAQFAAQRGEPTQLDRISRAVTAMRAAGKRLRPVLSGRHRISSRCIRGQRQCPDRSDEHDPPAAARGEFQRATAPRSGRDGSGLRASRRRIRGHRQQEVSRGLACDAGASRSRRRRIVRPGRWRRTDALTGTAPLPLGQ